MKRKGFTLIELLGVIIVLAVIALVTTPLVLDVVDEAKKKSNLNSALAYIEAAKLYYYEAQFDNDKMNDLNNLNNIYNKVELKGEKPETGELYATNNGQFGLAVEIENECYIKDFNAELTSQELELCSLGFVGIDEVRPTIEFSYEGVEGTNGWYKGELWVTIDVLDTESGPSSIKWCTGLDCTPTTEEKVITKSLLLDSDIDTVICAVGYDKYGNASEKVCSKNLKIDKQAPSFTGIEDLTVMKDSILDLRENVIVEDNLSGVNSFTVTPDSISTSIAGSTTVTYKAVDNAGNEATVERKVVVDAIAPTVTFTPEAGKINNNGWAKEDFYVDITVNDQSGLGIKEFYVCTGNESDRCNPQDGSYITSGNTAQRTIEVEHANNRICVQATDNNNRTSEILCSDAYKLDKTAPSITGLSNIAIDKGGTINLDTGVSVSDGLSQPDGTYSYTPVSISNTTVKVTTVTYTAKDKAGNVKTLTRTVEVLGDAPTISYSSNGTFNSYGWAKANFNINAAVTDNSGKGIKSIKYCSTTQAECAPTTAVSSVSVAVSTNSATNKICVQAIDNNDKATTTCSGNYALDKEAPTAGTATISGTLGNNSWYKSNVTITPVDGSDSSTGSGHLSTTTNVSSITSDTIGTTVTITTTDKAGNSSTRDYTIKVDKTAPVISSVSSSKTDKTITVTANVTEANGIANYYYSINNGSYTSSTSKSHTFSGLLHGTSYTIKVYAVDAAGNESTVNTSTVTTTALTASQVILANKTIGTRTSFGSAFTSATTNQIYSGTDDLGTTYYFAGKPTDNYVYFAGFYWRIVRINGNGSVRLIYQGPAANSTGTAAQITSAGFSDNTGSYKDNAGVGYMYGTNSTWKDGGVSSSTSNMGVDDLNYYYGTSYTIDPQTGYGKVAGTLSSGYLSSSRAGKYTCFNETADEPCTYVWYITSYSSGTLKARKVNAVDAGTVTSYSVTHANTNSSNAKKILDNWYANNIATNYGKYIDVNAGFCNDRSLSSGTGAGKNNTYYKPYDRESSSPIFTCPQSADLFTATTSSYGNKKLTYPIGLITSDEVDYSGSGSSYLYTGERQWTMSPVNGGESAKLWCFSNGYTLCGATVENGIRPVINLKPDVILHGSGTASNPYTVK